jgi:hypothetical protein
MVDLLRRAARLHLEVEDLAALDVDRLVRRERQRRAVLLLEQRVGVRRLPHLVENLGDRPLAALDGVRAALDRDGDDFLVCSNEALQIVIREVDRLVRLDDVVLAVLELSDQLESAGLPVDECQQRLAGRMLLVDRNLVAVDKLIDSQVSKSRPGHPGAEGGAIRFSRGASNSTYSSSAVSAGLKGSHFGRSKVEPPTKMWIRKTPLRSRSDACPLRIFPS